MMLLAMMLPAERNDIESRSPAAVGGERRSPWNHRCGFTLVELLVVMGIMVMAAGLMTPALAEFFRNRTLDNISGQFNGTFGRARVKAVTEGRDISVVFLKEGLRIYDEYNKVFVDQQWSASDSPLSDGSKVWYVLGCAAGRTSIHPGYEGEDRNFSPSVPFVPPYSWFQSGQTKRRKERKDQGLAVHERQVWVKGVAKVTYHRDGTLTFGQGLSDVRSADFRRDPPIMADVMVYQIGNRAVGYIDLKRTGQVRKKVAVMEKPTRRFSNAQLAR